MPYTLCNTIIIGQEVTVYYTAVISVSRLPKTPLYSRLTPFYLTAEIGFFYINPEPKDNVSISRQLPNLSALF
jgi:hypothetical protein